MQIGERLERLPLYTRCAAFLDSFCRKIGVRHGDVVVRTLAVARRLTAGKYLVSVRHREYSLSAHCRHCAAAEAIRQSCAHA